MAIIKAPYNFVPLENTAFYPEWANHISQDIPFEDGVSGSIEYTITAKTPIFVRNGQKLEVNQDKRDNSFSQTSDNRYFIPGTSIKGEIRNVLEILSLGKMTQVQDSRFSVRDLGRGPEGDRYRHLIRNVSCGWLKKDGDKYTLEDCGKPGRIAPEEIDGHFRSELKKFDLTLKLGTSKTGNSKEDDEMLRASYAKYNLLKLIRTHKDNQPSLDMESLEGEFEFVKEDDFGKEFYRYGNRGKKGTLVLTGQPSARKQKNGEWSGKYYEFVFFASQRTVVVGGDVVEDFLTIHKNNYDFLNLWRNRLYSGQRIPVFFIKDVNDSIAAIGLAYMFRYPTANFIKGSIPAALQSSLRKDLAECMFGTESKVLGALKGRVFFSPVFAEGQPQQLEQVDTTLSSPKASFGPLYVKGGTWDDSNALIKGRKRYPVRDNIWNNEQGNANTECHFIPLAKGTIFKGTVRFHNLKKEEYGALLSAMTFNGHSECFHSIGEAKPLGYGKVKIDITKADAVNLVSGAESGMEEALGSFNAMMVNFYPRWKTCPSLTELYAMAKGIPSGRESEFTYLKMNTSPNDNEFKAVKDKGISLAPFTSIIATKGQTDPIKNDPARKINLKSSLDAQIKEYDDSYLADIEDKQNERRSIRNIRDYLVNGDLLKAKELIQGLNLEIIEKAELEKELEGKIQDYANSVDNLFGTFMDSYKRKAPEEAIVEADKIIGFYANLMTLEPAELKYVEKKHLLENIRQRLISDGNNVDQSLTEYYDSIPLYSVAAFAGKLKKWMEAHKLGTLTEDLARELGQIVKDKSANLKSADKKTWKDRRKWTPIENLIGKANTDAAFYIAFN